MVVQQNLADEGEVLIIGYSDTVAQDIQVKFVPFAPSTGVTTQWESCEIYNDAGETKFRHVAVVTAGWYNLKVRMFQDGNVTDSVTISKVGVGEVFVISGQSNAQGQPFNNSSKATDKYERVSIILGYDEEMDTGPSFDYYPLESGYVIYPVGFSSWCWGELGDSIVSRFNVPVMFLNAAWGGTSSEDWAKSIDGTAQKEPSRGYIPYRVLQRTLQFYRNIFGFRAVLWHQGESDTFQTLPPYFKNIKKVIETTRTQVNGNLPWVVSKVSYILSLTNQKVLDDQQRLISELPMVFAGPYTDTIQNVRDDNIHFTNNNNKKGLGKLAKAWNQALTDSFFLNAQPLLPINQKIAYKIAGNPTVFPDSTTSYGDGGFNYRLIKDQKSNFYVCGYQPCKNLHDLDSTVDDHVVGRKRLLSTNVIKASNHILSGEMIYNSKNNIELRPGFEVNSGSIFTAKIGGCTN